MPDGPDLLALVPAALALAVRGLVVAGDAALGGVGNERAAELALASRSGRALVKLKLDPERTQGGVRAALSLGLAAAAAVVSLVAIQLGRRFGGPELAWAAAGAVVTWLSTVITDVIPRSVASTHPEPWALRTAPLLFFAREALWPLTRLVTALVDLVLRPFGVKTRFSLPPPPLEELERMLVHSRHAGAPEPALVSRLFDFGEQTVRDIMIPRTDLLAIPHDATPDDLVRLLVEEGHTRVPVYKSTLDTILGIIHVKDVLPLIANPELIILHDLIRPTMFVPWNMPIQKVMRELQRKHQHFAVVVDEYGGVAGIVTLEDIVEQIVGDIRDEFDEVPSDVVPSADGTSLVRGEMRVGEFNRTFQAEVPEDQGFETMGGFLSSLAGTIPSENDRFYHGGLEFLVARRDPRRVVEIKVTRTRSESDVPPTEVRV